VNKTLLRELILNYLNLPECVWTIEGIYHYCLHVRNSHYYNYEISREVWKMNSEGLLSVLSGKIYPIKVLEKQK
jgi:hypothetical protein